MYLIELIFGFGTRKNILKLMNDSNYSYGIRSETHIDICVKYVSTTLSAWIVQLKENDQIL